jgi:hypothetical protein
VQRVFRKLLQQKLVEGVEGVESEVARVDEPERMPKTILDASKCRIIYQLVHVELLACEQEGDKEVSSLHCELCKYFVWSEGDNGNVGSESRLLVGTRG